MPLTPTVTLPRRAISLDPDAYTWKPLRLLNVYRVFLAGVLLLMNASGYIPHLIGRAYPQLFLGVVLLYLAAGVGALYLGSRRQPRFETQVYVQSYIDIVAIVLLMHASGGLESGVGMLLLVTITASGLLVTGRIAILLAALAALGILSQQLFSQLMLGPSATNYPQAGLLGATLFATAFLALLLSRKGRESAALAEQRGIDLENLAELSEHIIEHMDSGIVVVDAKGRMRLANESARQTLGLPAYTRNPPLESMAPRLAYSLDSWRQHPDETPPSFKEPDTTAELRPQFVPLGNQGTLVYLEDASFINQQLQQLKLASLGRLTASIAHEVRNPLGAISHASQLLSESAELAEPDRRLTQIIDEHCRRMNTIVEDILQLSRGGNVKPELQVLNEELPQLAHQYCTGERLPLERISLELPKETVRVYVDANHLRQVLWNLWTNGFLHGAGDDPPQVVNITTTLGRLSDTGHPYVDVKDDGLGIDAAQVEEIFEPFFTSSRKGTGLGLFLARELCEFNNANLSYLPTESGTCFRIAFNKGTS
ncbi:MAG: ATP-binding protein [Gammaproteobacteria bacterium]|nr:ATP-binding protein [Gammaproteobacteria bacterium]